MESESPASPRFLKGFQVYFRQGREFQRRRLKIRATKHSPSIPSLFLSFSPKLFQKFFFVQNFILISSFERQIHVNICICMGRLLTLFTQIFAFLFLIFFLFIFKSPYILSFYFIYLYQFLSILPIFLSILSVLSILFTFSNVH